MMKEAARQLTEDQGIWFLSLKMNYLNFQKLKEHVSVCKLRAVEKEYKQEFVTENSKPVRRMAEILRQSWKFLIYKIYV